MTGEVPGCARQLAARLAALFVSDGQIAVRLNDAQRRLRHANSQLWPGLHPDVRGVVYGAAHAAAVAHGASAVAGWMIDAFRAGGGEGEVATAVVSALRQAQWTIHSAFVDYQSAREERRRLAVCVGELSVQLTEALCAAGWSAQAARDANVHELAGARA